MVQSTRAACPWTSSNSERPWLAANNLPFGKRKNGKMWTWDGIRRADKKSISELSLCHNIWHSHFPIWQFRFLKKQYIINCHYFHPIFPKTFWLFRTMASFSILFKTIQYSVPPKLTESCHTQSLGMYLTNHAVFFNIVQNTFTPPRPPPPFRLNM